MRLTSAELHPTLARTETCGLKQAGVHFNINAYMCMCETQQSNTSASTIEFHLFVTTTGEILLSCIQSLDQSQKASRGFIVDVHIKLVTSKNIRHKYKMALDDVLLLQTKYSHKHFRLLISVFDGSGTVQSLVSIFLMTVQKGFVPQERTENLHKT